MKIKSNTKPPLFELIETYPIDNTTDYKRFINWVVGEFDLYLKEESRILKVYFPNGWFSIGKFKNGEHLSIEIKLTSNSKTTCENISKKLVTIYNHIQAFVA